MASLPFQARRTVEMLIAAPAQAVPFLRDRLQPATIDASKFPGWIADLDSDDFESRHLAEQELARAIDAAAPALRQALAAGVPLESRRRINHLLKLLDPAAVPPGEQLRSLRAAHVLESVGGADVLEHLTKLSRGDSKALLTDAARGALLRCKRATTSSR
jgi:hypothetical protein